MTPRVDITEHTEHPFLSYAIPNDGIEPTPQEVAALIDVFVARGRVPRPEYLERCAPAVLAALETAGFTVEGRLQAMTATRPAVVPVAAGYAIESPVGECDPAQAFGEGV